MFYLLFFISSVGYAIPYEDSDDCGISHLQSQQDILSAQTCLKERLIIMDNAITHHESVATVLDSNVKLFNQSKALCEKLKVYYENVRTEWEKEIYYTNAKDCFYLHNQRIAEFNRVGTKYQQVIAEFEKLKIIRLALQGKFDMLQNNADLLIKQGTI
jgi:hypothetical protein